jgi:hypothetical protein
MEVGSTDTREADVEAREPLRQSRLRDLLDAQIAAAMPDERSQSSLPSERPAMVAIGCVMRSVTKQWIDTVQERTPIGVPAEIFGDKFVEESPGPVPTGALHRRGHVRRDHQPLLDPELVVGRERLGSEGIDDSCSQTTGAEGSQEGALIDALASRDIDSDSAGREGVENSGIDDAAGLIRQWETHNDCLRVSTKVADLIEPANLLRDDALRVAAASRCEALSAAHAGASLHSENAHAVNARGPGNLAPDRSIADQKKRLSCEWGREQVCALVLQWPMSSGMRCSPVRAPLVDVEECPHDVLRNRGRICSSPVRDHQSTTPRCIVLHVVYASHRNLNPSKARGSMLVTRSSPGEQDFERAVVDRVELSAAQRQVGEGERW